MQQNISTLISEPKFKQIDEQTLQLNFGKANIYIKKDGHICLQNPHAKLVIEANGAMTHSAQSDISINTAKNIRLNTDLEQ